MTKDKEEKEKMKNVKEKTDNTNSAKRYSFPLVYVIAGLVLLIILSILIYCFIVAK